MIFAYEVQFIPSDYVEYTNSEEGIISAPSLSEAVSKIERYWGDDLASVKLSYLESKAIEDIVPINSIKKHFNLANS